MSKSDIHSWIAAARDEGSDDENDTPDVGEVNEEEDWTAFCAIAQTRLLGDGTRARIEFLKERLGVVAARGGACYDTPLDLI